jgi:signal transduction histidine kinase/CheY-like chemotaxis protein
MRSTLPRIRLSLRTLLACLVLAALVPVAAVLAWQVYEDLRAERNRTEDELVRAAAGFALAVDRELASSLDALRVLSESELFQQGRIAAMGRLLHGRPRRDWDSIFVLDAQGNVVLDTASRPSPAITFRPLHQQVMGKLAPVVSGFGDGSGIAIATPVMQGTQQGAQARYVLGVRLSNTLWPRLASAATLPAGAQARLYDRDGNLISQSVGISPAGARLPPEALHAMLRQDSGVQRSSEADGNDVYAAWDAVTLAGWHSRVFVPAAPVDAAHRRLLMHAASTSGIALLAGLLLSAVVAHAILRRARRQESITRARDDALAQQDWRDEFVAMLTHELRNPLGAISAAADVLESTHPTSASAADARGVVSRQARQLSYMMHALLDASRAIAGKIELSRRPIDLGALVRHVDETLAFTGEGREHMLVLQLAPEVWVEGDSVRLEQVVSNVLIHVAKCTSPGQRIVVRSFLEGDVAVLEVRSARREGRAAGTPGIEWTLAHALVQLHGGSLVATYGSEMNEIVARMPAAAVPEREEDARALPPSRRRKVLVLQGDDRSGEALLAELALEGHTVTTSASEVDALARMVELQPDVALIDLRSSRSPFDFARRLRAAGYAGRMIALAMERSDASVRDARAAGFDEVVAQPVDPRKLRESLAPK